MSAHTVALVTIRCDAHTRGQRCRQALQGSESETATDVRRELSSYGWDISDDGDYCAGHKGIPAVIRGRRAVERAEADRHLGLLREKMAGESTGESGTDG